MKIRSGTAIAIIELYELEARRARLRQCERWRIIMTVTVALQCTATIIESLVFANILPKPAGLFICGVPLVCFMAFGRYPQPKTCHSGLLAKSVSLARLGGIASILIAIFSLVGVILALANSSGLMKLAICWALPIIALPLQIKLLATLKVVVDELEQIPVNADVESEETEE